MEEAKALSENLQRAVALTISAGYQLDKEAFDFLERVSQTKDPVKLIEAAVKRVESLPEKPFFISRGFLEKTFGEIFPEEEKVEHPSPTQIMGAKEVFHAYAKDVEADIRVVDDPTEKVCGSGSIEDFLEYFQDRFRRLQKILRRRMDAKDASSISEALKASANSKVKVIGMITEKREQKGKLFLIIEDLEAAATVLVPSNVPHEVLERARMLMLDQVVCIKAIKGRNDLLIAEDFVWPDVPQRNPQKASAPVYVAFTSDLHVGSKLFMRKAFNRFILWLNGKFGDENQRALASHVKYVVIAGDIVDGIGIYPGQRKELAIRDVYAQYREASRLIEQIPDYIELIVIPGNHDASRKALPQPALPRDYAEPLYEAREVRSLGNPCVVRLHEVELLLYHGRSLDDVIASVPNVSFHTPDKAMKLLLQSRHLAPIYGKKTSIAPEKQDFMVIENPPDIFQCGHVHVLKYDNYRGTLLVNSGAWQNQTEYQRKMGLVPTPGVVPIVNLQTLHVTTVDFTMPD
jgi:DNA polymerase II small subunit